MACLVVNNTPGVHYPYLRCRHSHQAPSNDFAWILVYTRRSRWCTSISPEFYGRSWFFSSTVEAQPLSAGRGCCRLCCWDEAPVNPIDSPQKRSTHMSTNTRCLCSLLFCSWTLCEEAAKTKSEVVIICGLNLLILATNPSKQEITNLSLDPLPPLLQGGTSGYDRWRGILANADGSVTLAGLSWGLWGDSNAGAGDIAASKLDENGTDIWNWQVTYTTCMSYLRPCTGGVVRKYRVRYANVRKTVMLP